MKKLIIPLTLLALTLGFGSHVSASAECFAVSGELDQTGDFNGLSGTFSGDIEGTIVTVAGPVDFHGVTVFRPIDQTWQVSGGIVDPLIGATLHFEGDFKGIVARYPILIVQTTLRLADGAQKGNLTLHGWTDLSDAPALFINHSEYHGVICP
jgi:hypothetical protein